MLQDLVNPLD